MHNESPVVDSDRVATTVPPHAAEGASAVPIYDDVTKLDRQHPARADQPAHRRAPATVAAKLEFYNPASSVKDRIGVAIVDAAEASG